LFVAGGDDGAAAAHSAKCSGGFHAEVPSLGGDQVADLVLLEVSPHILDWIEFRSVGRKAFHRDASSGTGHIVLHQTASMNRGTVPDDGQLSWNMPLEMPEELDHLRPLDAARVDLEVEPVQSQTSDDGEALPTKGLLDQRSLPTRCPGARPGGAGAQSAFVDKDEGSALFAGFFFIAGHSTRFQRPILASSRSMARRSGRWQLNPLSPSNRQTCPGWY